MNHTYVVSVEDLKMLFNKASDAQISFVGRARAQRISPTKRCGQGHYH